MHSKYLLNIFTVFHLIFEFLKYGFNLDVQFDPHSFGRVS